MTFNPRKNDARRLLTKATIDYQLGKEACDRYYDAGFLTDTDRDDRYALLEMALRAAQVHYKEACDG